MSIQSIDVLREIYKIWNNPPISRLDTSAVVDALNRVYSQRKLDLGLSGGSFLAKVSAPFQINSHTRTANLADYDIDTHFLQIRVERQGSNSNHYESSWHEIPIASYANWDTYRDSQNPYAAFFGSADSPSILVNHSPGNASYRLVYEPDGAFVGEDDDDGLEMPRLFQPLLTYDLAIEAGYLIDDDSPEFERKLRRNVQHLTMRQGDALERFKKWLASRRSQTVETREGFNERGNWAGINAVGIPQNLYLNGGEAYLRTDDNDEFILAEN